MRFGFKVESHNHWLDEASRFEFMGWMARHHFHPVKGVRAQIDATVPELTPAGIFVLRVGNVGREMRRLTAFIDFTLDIRPLNSEANSHDYEIWWDRKHLSAIATRYGQPVHVFVFSTSFTGSYRLGDFDGALDSRSLAESQLNYGRAHEGQKYLNTLKKLMEIQMYGAVPETLRGDRPIPCGSPLQGATSSMLIRGTFGGLLGLTPNAFANDTALEPTVVDGVSLELGCIRIGDALVDLQVTSASRKVKIKSSKALRATVALPMEREDEKNQVEVQGATIQEIRTRKSLRGFRAAVCVDLREKRTTTVPLNN